jgi:acyl carrier protein
MNHGTGLSGPLRLDPIVDGAVDDTERQVLSIVARETKQDVGRLRRETPLSAINIDSLQLVQVLFAIEETFDIYVPSERDKFRLDTLGDVIDGVKRLVAEKQSGYRA